MKSEISSKRADKPYPKLMRVKDKKPNEEYVVLFTSFRNGIVVARGAVSPHPLGHYSAVWDGEWFEDFDGAVTLSNG